MLVKFGRIGKPIKEYYVDDDTSLEDLIEIAGIELDNDDTVQRISGGSKVVLDSICDEELRENATYILERIEFTPQEKRIADILDDEWDPDESVANQKATIKKIMACGWDK